MRTQLARDLGLEFPIFAFSHCRDVVAAVSRAGGMGVLGALYFTPDELETGFRRLEEAVAADPDAAAPPDPATLLTLERWP